MKCVSVREIAVSMSSSVIFFIASVACDKTYQDYYMVS